jgi:hypothetical protein
VLTAPVSVASSAGSTSGVGTYPVTASGAAASNYSFAYVDGVLTVNPALLNVKAGSGSRLYGAANPALGASYSGFVNGESTAVLTAPASVASSANAGSGVGTYAVTASGAAASNYSFVYVDGVLTVSPAVLDVHAASATRTYGAANPALGASYSGFVNGETAAVLTAPASSSTAATSASGVGAYRVAASGAAAANYTFAYVDGVLTVVPAVLQLTAGSGARTYGAANPPLAVGYSGFVNGDTVASLSAPASVATNAGATSGVGAYRTTAQGAAADNYSFTFVDGVLTVNPALVTATANNVSRVYGSATPALSVGYAGFVNGENASALAVQASATSAGARNVGSYPIAVAGAQAANYIFRYVDGILSVAAAPLTVKASDALRLFGTPNPAFGATFAGFQYDDTPAALGGALRLDTAATAASAPGVYAIVPSGLAASNYTIAYQDGALLVGSPALSLPGMQAAIGGAARPLAIDAVASAQAAGAAASVGLNGLNLAVAGSGISLPPELDCKGKPGCQAPD